MKKIAFKNKKIKLFPLQKSYRSRRRQFLQHQRYFLFRLLKTTRDPLPDHSHTATHNINMQRRFIGARLSLWWKWFFYLLLALFQQSTIWLQRCSYRFPVRCRCRHFVRSMDTVMPVPCVSEICAAEQKAYPYICGNIIRVHSKKQCTIMELLLSLRLVQELVVSARCIGEWKQSGYPVFCYY